VGILGIMHLKESLY